MTQGDAVEAGRPGPEMRIGTAERESAASALNEHLNAGRLEVQEYADRSARAANASVAHELTELFTDLPAPHPALPGAAPAPVAAPPAEVDPARPSAMDTWGPRIVAAGPIVALVLFLVFREWWFFLLVPLAGAVVYGGHGSYGGHGFSGGHGHRRRDDRHQGRDERRTAADEPRDRRDGT
ncbi:DUF1707 domain-containing protein [Pseudonocardia sp. KRD291]|uniref:DUF1707 SHOCT-like domain-containing protein n=1 Tax=Pseudonocardia sp. KRD291 TaxID=2792007 RepID=UPI001C4A3EBF|nr:DUF1707 domain-containing protein [Pseudonocardia sp. KRD291]MBW0103238.1 DUF1707 domain-containing protein [Pseudonocardia sp. KRD291]